MHLLPMLLTLEFPIIILSKTKKFNFQSSGLQAEHSKAIKNNVQVFNPNTNALRTTDYESPNFPSNRCFETLKYALILG